MSDPAAAARRHAIVVSPVLPAPETQGNRRVIASMIRWLARRGYDVTLVYQGRVGDPAQRAEIESMGCELRDLVRRTPGRSDRWFRWSRRIALECRRFDRWNRRHLGVETAICSHIPAWEERIVHHPNRECWADTVQEVSRLARERSTALVVCEYFYQTPVLCGLPPSVLKVVQTIDCHCRVWQKVGRHAIDTHAREVSPGLEGYCLSRADVVLAIQEDEARTFRAIAPSTDVVVLGYNPGLIPDRPVRRASAPVVFVPAGPNPSNRAGLRWLLYEIWPLVREACPGATLRVAGEAGPTVAERLHGVEILGRVADLAPEYERARVVVNPVATGTGLKIKTVEALGLGKALVSTANGVEGLPGGREPAWRVADTTREFAGAVARLCLDERACESLEIAALAYAHTHLTEPAVYESFAGVLAAHESRTER